jgi:hypothetical protein
MQQDGWRELDDHCMKSTNSLWAQIITVGKSVLDETLDGINRQRGNRSLQRARSLHQCSYVHYDTVPTVQWRAFWS